jgi:hypothetical protein
MVGKIVRGNIHRLVLKGTYGRQDRPRQYSQTCLKKGQMVGKIVRGDIHRLVLKGKDGRQDRPRRYSQTYHLEYLFHFAITNINKQNRGGWGEAMLLVSFKAGTLNLLAFQ